jgi:hypothetical protein
LPDGNYLYCIVEPDVSLAVEGIFSRPCRVVTYKDIGAVVSTVPYVEPEPSLDNIVAHEKVVEAARLLGTTLPVKFGVIFRNEEGVRTLLSASYKDYRSKLDKFNDTDEYGVKVILKTQGMQKLREGVGKESKEIARMQAQAAKAKQGKSYFLKMKLDEAIKVESYKKIDELSHQIHDELSRQARTSAILKTEHAQIILNAAYLVNRKEGDAFVKFARKVGQEYASLGLMVHTSGPWAPYSFVEGAKK